MRLVFDDHAFEDLAWFVSKDPKLAKKSMTLIQEVRILLRLRLSPFFTATFWTRLMGNHQFDGARDWLPRGLALGEDRPPQKTTSWVAAAALSLWSGIHARAG